MRRTASEILHNLETRIARLETRIARLGLSWDGRIGEYPKLVRALKAWSPSFTDRDLIESLDGIVSKGVMVKHEEDKKDGRFHYEYGSIKGIHGNVYCFKSSQIKGELEFTWSPDVPVLDNQDRGALVDLSKAMGELLAYVEAEVTWGEALDEEVYGSDFKGSLKLLGVRVVNNKLVVKVMADVEAGDADEIDCDSGDDYDYDYDSGDDY